MGIEFNDNGRKSYHDSAIGLGLQQLENMLEDGGFRDRGKLVSDIMAYRWLINNPNYHEEYYELRLEMTRPVRDCVAIIKKRKDRIDSV